MTAAPPWVLACAELTITRPQPPAIDITLPPRVAIDVPWPRRQVTHATPPPAPRLIQPAVPPQGPWRMPLAAVVRDLLASPLPPRRR